MVDEDGDIMSGTMNVPKLGADQPALPSLKRCRYGKKLIILSCLSGQVVDGPQYGMSPPPWDIPVSVPLRYTDVVEKVRVPHSSLVKVQLLFYCFRQ